MRKKLRGIWKVVVEDLSSSSVDFLDLCIFKVPGSSRLHYKPYHKPTRVRIALNPESSHPSFCHLWMMGEVVRLARNSSSAASYREAIMEFVHELSRCHAGNTTIELVLHQLNRFLHHSSFHKSRVQPARSTTRKLVFSLDFHPLWERAGFRNGLEGVFKKYAPLLDSLGFRVEPKLAWRLSSCSFACRLRAN